MIPDGIKCRKCGAMKSPDCFNVRRRNASGFETWCKECTRACHRAWVQKNKDKHRKRSRDNWDKPRQKDLYYQRTYGITLAQYDAMVLAQQGLCFICRESPRDGQKLCVDHDHGTGKIRKLLCNECNHALGQAKERPELLRMMALYLESHKD